MVEIERRPRQRFSGEQMMAAIDHLKRDNLWSRLVDVYALGDVDGYRCIQGEILKSLAELTFIEEKIDVFSLIGEIQVYLIKEYLQLL